MRPIAVLSAVRGEGEELHRVMKVDHESSRGGEDSHGQRDYWAGTIFGAPVVVAWSRWGKVAAASTTTHIIDLYEPPSPARHRVYPLPPQREWDERASAPLSCRGRRGARVRAVSFEQPNNCLIQPSPTGQPEYWRTRLVPLPDLQ